MSITLPLEKMSREDKLIAMETIWSDLTSDETYASPIWHVDVLAETERQVANGSATFSAWEEAKQRIQQQIAAKV